VGISVPICVQGLPVSNAECVTITVTEASCGFCQSLKTNSGIFDAP
jgi:hypothetical protein